MNYLENKKIVQSNSLVRQTNWKLNKTPLKLFKACIASIDTSNPPKDNTVVVHKSDLIQLLELDKKQNYVYLKEQLRSLITSVKIEEDDKHERFVALVNDIYWEKDADIVKVEFHKAVMPYLIDLHERFLEYPADVIPQFDSKYGLIIYESLLSNWKQYADSNEFTYDVDTLRYITGTEKKHKKWTHYTLTISEMGNKKTNFGSAVVIKDITQKELNELKETAIEFCKQAVIAYNEDLEGDTDEHI